MVVIANNRIGIDTAGKNFAYFQNAPLHPSLAMFKAPTEVVIKAAKPSAPHTASDAVKTGGVVWVDKSFAGLGNGAVLRRASATWTRNSLRLG